ncbi:hypothetical protein BJF78_08220 [Pseudonocardia sp. CNS-139]|nr:hypothetical protein BJF78_08220 [Pseudonocardia sp. CNS-139]
MATTRPYRSPRRAGEAADTRRDILTAARELFSAHGYARVTVADIAKRAGTAVKTVYASAGTKADILNELIAVDVEGSGAAENLAEVRATRDLGEAMRVLARGTRTGNEANRETLDILFSSMSSHDVAADVWQRGTTSYRATLHAVARHLADGGQLAPGLTVGRAADRLWFCFGLAAWRTLVVDCGWSYDEAEDWLCRQAVRMLGEG